MLPQLKADDLIYICSPAKAIETEHLQIAKSFFEQNGYRVQLGNNASGSNNYFSGTVDERLSDFQKGIDNPDVKVVLSARGGYGCMQILDLLDWSKFDKHPKHIVGFSDMTAFHLLMSQKGIPSLHATMPLNFKENSPQSLRSMLSALQGTPETLCAESSPFNKSGVARGTVIGGNLALVHALLPRFSKEDFKNKILFLEDVGENLYQIDRMLYGLSYSGAIDVISGVMLGGFTHMSDTDSPFGKCIEEIILSHFTKRKIPIGFGFPCGHQDDNQTLILGGQSVFSVDKNGSSLTQSFIENPS